jgi:hypothetical protein
MPIALLVIGVTLVGASLVWPSWLSGRSAWSNDQARRLQSASAEFHHLSHEYGEELSGSATAETPSEFRQAEAEFRELSRQLDAARSRPAHVATVLRLIGVILSIAGAATYLSVSRG